MWDLIVFLSGTRYLWYLLVKVPTKELIRSLDYFVFPIFRPTVEVFWFQVSTFKCYWLLLVLAYVNIFSTLPNWASFGVGMTFLSWFMHPSTKSPVEIKIPKKVKISQGKFCSGELTPNIIHMNFSFELWLQWCVLYRHHNVDLDILLWGYQLLTSHELSLSRHGSVLSETCTFTILWGMWPNIDYWSQIYPTSPRYFSRIYYIDKPKSSVEDKILTASDSCTGISSCLAKFVPTYCI